MASHLNMALLVMAMLAFSALMAEQGLAVDFDKQRPLTVTAPASSSAYANGTVNFTIDTSSGYTGLLSPSGNCTNLIVTYLGEEIESHAENCGTANTLINFTLQAGIGAGASDSTSYALMYNNNTFLPDRTYRSGLCNRAYFFCDDFGDASIDADKWVVVAGAPTESGGLLSLTTSDEISATDTYNASSRPVKVVTEAQQTDSAQNFEPIRIVSGTVARGAAGDYGYEMFIDGGGANDGLIKWTAGANSNINVSAYSPDTIFHTWEMDVLNASVPSRVRVQLDGQISFRTHADSAFLGGRVHFQTGATAADWTYVMMLITTDDGLPVTVAVSGEQVGNGTSGNALLFSDAAFSPAWVFNGNSLFVNVTVTNGTENATVGAAYMDFFGTNRTMFRALAFANSSGGGVFSFNGTVSGQTNGTKTLRFYATETVQAPDLNVTDSGVTAQVPVLNHRVEFVRFDTPVRETNRTAINISVTFGSDVSSVHAYLRWNSTNQSFTSASNSSPTHTNVTNSFVVPFFTRPNNTAVFFDWNVTINYANGSRETYLSANASQQVFYAYSFRDITLSSSQVLSAQSFTATVRSVTEVFTYIPNYSMSVSFGSGGIRNTSFLYNQSVVPGPAPGFRSDAWSFVVFAPNISEANRTVPFNATFTVQNGSESRVQTAQGNVNVVVYKPILNRCGSGFADTHVMSLYHYNESTNGNASLVGTISADAVFLVYESGNRSGGVNSSFSMSGANAYVICMYPGNMTLRMDGDFRYQQSVDLEPRSYFLNNATISSPSTNDIKLFTLPADKSTLMKVVIKDSSGNLLQDHTVKILKYFQGTNSFETVAMTKTDLIGQGNTYIQINDIFYKFVIELDGSVKKNVDSYTIKCDPADCVQTFIIDVGSTLETLNFANKIAGSCTYVNGTLTLTCSWTDTTGLSPTMCLDIREFGFIRPIQTSHQCVESTAGTIGYTFSAFNQSKQYFFNFFGQFGSLEGNTTTLDSDWIIYSGSGASSVFGLNGVAIGFIVIGTFALIGLFSPVIGVMLIIAAAGAMQLMGILDLGSGGVAGIAMVGVVVIWLIRRRRD